MSSPPRSDDAPLLRPAETAQRLGIPASTLRRWSRRFAAFLSPQANGALGADGARGHRRYTPDDLMVLARCKALLSQGFTFEQVAQRLESDFEPEAWVVEGKIEEAKDEGKQGSQPPQTGDLMPTEEAADLGQMMTQMLATLSGSQQMLITGQQAARDLLSLIIQDNLNLKEENKHLRERMVETERRIFEMKREMTRHREEERERMRQMEAYLFQLQRQLDDLTRSQRPPAFPLATAPHLPPPARSAAPPVSTP
ncbi:MAG TPA: MerR family transcriptional regulator, partial [Caldilineae bacterium]|nr:MerR family transcriptional regulator [Caldilineae bacterium]